MSSFYSTITWGVFRLRLSGEASRPVNYAKMGRSMQLRANKRIITTILAVVIWFALWLLVPGLTENSIGARLSDNAQTGLLIDIFLAGITLVILFLTHRRFSQTLFKKQPIIWLYLLPFAAIMLIPLRVDGIDGEIFGNPAWLYVSMMIANVVTQQYLTFGLLQSHLNTVLSPWVSVIATTVIFYLGHALLLPDRFAPTLVVNALFILTLGLIFASLRQKTGTLHANIALHLAFYMVLI